MTDATPFIGQPVGATDPDGLLNMVVRNGTNGRRQFATRPKALLEYGGAAGSGRVNGLNSIARSSGVSSVIAVTPDDSTTGVSVPSGAFMGQAIVLDQDRTVRRLLNDTRGDGTAFPPPGGAGGYGAFQCCWHASNDDVGFFATIGTDASADSGNKVVIGISRFDLRSDTFTAQAYAVDADAPATLPVAGSLDLFSNQILQFGSYLFVCAFRYVYVFRQDTLQYICRQIIDWTEEVQGIQGVTVNGSDYLLVLGTGTTTTSGRPVTVDGTGSDRFGEFLGGALLYLVAPFSTAIVPGVAVLARLAMPMGLQSGDAGYEDHRFFRPSEWNVGRPHGCLCYAFAATAGTDGSVYLYIARTNQGFGYDGNDPTMQPNGIGPFVSACRANITRAFEVGHPAYVNPATPLRYGFSSAVGGWERDTASLRRPYTWGANTFQNDIPQITGGIRDPQLDGNEPTFWAVAVDTQRNRVFFAGRRSSLTGAAPTVYCFVAQTLGADIGGTLVWSADTGGTIQQNAIAVDPTSGNLLIAMRRNTNWVAPDGTSPGTSAEVLELNGETGQTVVSVDLTDAIDYNGYITAFNAASLGLGAYGIAVNHRGQALVALAPYRFDEP